SYSKTGGSFDIVRTYRIVTHPTDPLKIAAYGQGGGSVYQRRVIYTTNGGLPGGWTIHDDPTIALNAIQLDTDVVMTANGRLVVAGEITSPGNASSVIATSDDFGLSWTTRKNVGS